MITKEDLTSQEKAAESFPTFKVLSNELAVAKKALLERLSQLSDTDAAHLIDDLIEANDTKDWLLRQNRIPASFNERFSVGPLTAFSDEVYFEYQDAFEKLLSSTKFLAREAMRIPTLQRVLKKTNETKPTNHIVLFPEHAQPGFYRLLTEYQELLILELDDQPPLTRKLLDTEVLAELGPWLFAYGLLSEELVNGLFNFYRSHDKAIPRWLRAAAEEVIPPTDELLLHDHVLAGLDSVSEQVKQRKIAEHFVHQHQHRLQRGLPSKSEIGQLLPVNHEENPHLVQERLDELHQSDRALSASQRTFASLQSIKQQLADQLISFPSGLEVRQNWTKWQPAVQDFLAKNVLLLTDGTGAAQAQTPMLEASQELMELFKDRWSSELVKVGDHYQALCMVIYLLHQAVGQELRLSPELHIQLDSLIHKVEIWKCNLTKATDEPENEDEAPADLTAESWAKIKAELIDRWSNKDLLSTAGLVSYLEPEIKEKLDAFVKKEASATKRAHTVGSLTNTANIAVISALSLVQSFLFNDEGFVAFLEESEITMVQPLALGLVVGQALVMVANYGYLGVGIINKYRKNYSSDFYLYDLDLDAKHKLALQLETAETRGNTQSPELWTILNRRLLVTYLVTVLVVIATYIGATELSERIMESRALEQAETPFVPSNHEQPAPGRPSFFTFVPPNLNPADLPRIWIDSAGVLIDPEANQFRTLETRVQNLNQVPITFIAPGTLEDMVSDAYLKQGSIVRLNSGSSEFPAASDGWQLVEVITENPTLTATSSMILGGLRFDGQDLSTTAGLYRREVQPGADRDLLESPTQFAAALPSFPGLLGDSWLQIESDAWHNIRFTSLLMAQNGANIEEIEQYIYDNLDDVGLSYGYGEYSAEGLSPAETMVSLTQQKRLICNQFASLLYLISQDIGRGDEVALLTVMSDGRGGWGGFTTDKHMVLGLNDQNGDFEFFEATMPGPNGQVVNPGNSELEDDIFRQQEKEERAAAIELLALFFGVVSVGLLYVHLKHRHEIEAAAKSIITRAKLRRRKIVTEVLGTRARGMYQAFFALDYLQAATTGVLEGRTVDDMVQSLGKRLNELEMYQSPNIRLASAIIEQPTFDGSNPPATPGPTMDEYLQNMAQELQNKVLPFSAKNLSVVTEQLPYYDQIMRLCQDISTLDPGQLKTIEVVIRRHMQLITEVMRVEPDQKRRQFLLGLGETYKLVLQEFKMAEIKAKSIQS